MIINKLNMRSFGKFTDKEIKLYPGINVLYGPNESGKTTVHTFIKSMFFGLQMLRGRGARNDMYHRFEPWNHPADYAGDLYFESGGRHFRISRNFYREAITAELVCQDDGELLDIDKGDLSMLLGDISEVVYDNTVSIGQLRSSTDQDLVVELRNYMANYQGSGDASLDLGRTMEELKYKKKDKQEQLQAMDERRLQQMKNIRNTVSYLEKEMSEIDKKISRHEEILEKASKDIKRLNPSDIRKVINTSQQENEESKPNYAAAVLAMLLILSIVAAFMLWIPVGKWIKAAAVVLGGILEVVIIVHLMRKLPDRSQIEEEVAQGEEASQEEELRKTLEKAQWSLESLRERRQEKAIQIENLRNDLEEYRQQDYSSHPVEKDIEAITLAENIIRSLSNEMQLRLGEKLKVRTSQIFSEITQGKYEQITLDETLQMWVNTEQKRTSLSMMSRGTVEQVYFALRMAISDILCPDEELPVILDDVFAMYDDDRVQETLTWLERNRKQVIVGTCHTREQRLLDAMGMKYHTILL